MSGRPEQPEQQRFTFRQKWGDDFFASRGHTQVPNALLEFGATLGLEPAETGLLSHILFFKWDDGNPRPTIELLAKRLGKSVRMVRRYLRAIEEKGLLVIRPCYDQHGRQDANELDFTPLRDRINRLQGAVTDLSQGRLSDLSSSSLTDVSPSRGSDLSGSDESDVVVPDTVTTRQQQPPQSRRASARGTSHEHHAPTQRRVVATQESEDDEDDLIEALKALGITSSTAHRLAGRYEREYIARWLRYAQQRLAQGWVPQETPAAWLVAAIRSEDWRLPAWFEAAEEQRLEQGRQQQLAASERKRLESERAEEEQRDAEQRQQIESELGIEAKTRRLWEDTRTLLETRGEMSPALLSAYLLPLDDAAATIVTPVKFFCQVIERDADVIREALQTAAKSAVGRVRVEHRGGLV
jgi:Helix-turn-helix domain